MVERLIDLLLPIGEEEEEVGSNQSLPTGLQAEYLDFLRRSNGGYTKDNFFHFFGLKGPREHSLTTWNHPDLWKKFYGLNESIFFFAEDIFGNQYCFDLSAPKKVINILWVDSGELTWCGGYFEDFIEDIVLDHETDLELRDLSERFFRQRGVPYRRYQHLAYITPLCLGGRETDIDNLELAPSVTHLRLLGQIVTQVKKLPQGTPIKNISIDKEKGEVTLLTGD